MFSWNETWPAIRLTLLLAGGGTLLVMPVAIGLGWVLARKRFWGRPLLELAVLLPLVLPPVVVGYGLLLLLGRGGPLGGLQWLFTWKAMLLAGALVGLPLWVRAARAAFESVDPKLEPAARVLGASPAGTFFRITLPLAWPGLLAGAVLCFARALGEFGATRMVALNTPGQRTLSLELYALVEQPGDHRAALLALVAASLVLSALALGASELLTRRWRGGRP